MNLNFDVSLVENYHSNSQIARMLTENWVSQNMYCPRCGNPYIQHFENNRPVADFFCPICSCEYELKSKAGVIGRKINDGAYETMIERITGNRNPDFFLMSYSKEDLAVRNLIFIPKHFFVPDVIERRKPLSPTARRAGWVGCNILIEKIPKQGRISIISDGTIVSSDVVIKKVNIGNRLETRDINRRGWIMDVLNCINRVPDQFFSLEDMYSFENELQRKHPDNHNVKPKIRQQMQLLRDSGFVEFLGNGKYRKVL